MMKLKCVHPYFDSLRGDPEFERLGQRTRA